MKKYLHNIKDLLKNKLHLLHEAKTVVTLTSFDRSTQTGRSYERYRLIFMSAVTNVGAKAITSLVGLISVPLTLNYMGVEVYGLWMIISSLVVWLQLSDFGIGNGLLNALTEAYGRGDFKSANQYISASIVSLSVLAVITIYPTYLLSFHLPWEKLLNITDVRYIDLVRKCFFIVGVFFIISMPVSIVSKIFIAYQLGYIANILQVIVSVLSLGLVIICIFLKLSILCFAVLISFAPLAGNMILWFIFFRKMKWYSFSSDCMKGFHRVASSSVPLFIFQIAALAINNLINVIISNRSNLTLVAEYNIYNKIYMLIFFIGTAVAMPFYPAIREAMVRGDWGWARKSIKRVLTIRVLIVFICSLPFLVIGDWLVAFWSRHDMVYSLEIVGWLLLTICLVVVAASSTLGEILLYNDIIWPQIIIVFATAIILLVALYMSIPEYGMKSIYFCFIIANIHPIIWQYFRVKKWFQQKSQNT